MSLFQALYGRNPPTIPPYSRSSTSIQALDKVLQDRDVLLRRLKENLLSAQHRMQQKVNLRRRALQFNVGDSVLVRLQPYRQISLAHHTSQKLAKRYFGPFFLQNRISSVAYRLDLTLELKIHHVFHVSCLKLFRGDLKIPTYSLPSKSISNQPLQLPLDVCATRQVLVDSTLQPQVLVQSLKPGYDNLVECPCVRHAPDTRRIRVRYATWRVVDHIVGQKLRIRLVHGSNKA